MLALARMPVRSWAYNFLAFNCLQQTCIGSNKEDKEKVGALVCAEIFFLVRHGSYLACFTLSAGAVATGDTYLFPPILLWRCRGTVHARTISCRPIGLSTIIILI